MTESSRRKFLARAAATMSAAVLAGCDKISQSTWGPNVLRGAEQLTHMVQRAITNRHALAPEFTKADIAPIFRANGTLNPDSDDYDAHVATGFRNWRVAVRGLVHNPLDLSVADLRAMPSRTQITRHDCVEGWSCIGEWTGALLSEIIIKAEPKRHTKFVVFHCADNMSNDDNHPQFYYESLDLIEAMHPQTILAYDLNGKPLPVANGAPVRLRAERQLGYKMAKYVNGIELVTDFNHINGGKGGYWEDQGYNWWAGI
ncbi:MAG TPA: molybdopterin-dependent oxidoreductase [Rhizomicrobium sp.]|jgi:DMSO/TMAO reductase YedYZ molybdopterin-dependent catalytic subunit|nr:molybdopterin-dependent oxidoreductase [Rhizomicrobium sp.]